MLLHTGAPHACVCSEPCRAVSGGRGGAQALALVQLQGPLSLSSTSHPSCAHLLPVGARPEAEGGEEGGAEGQGQGQGQEGPRCWAGVAQRANRVHLQAAAFTLGGSCLLAHTQPLSLATPTSSRPCSPAVM